MFYSWVELSFHTIIVVSCWLAILYDGYCTISLSLRIGHQRTEKKRIYQQLQINCPHFFQPIRCPMRQPTFAAQRESRDQGGILRTAVWLLVTTIVEDDRSVIVEMNHSDGLWLNCTILTMMGPLQARNVGKQSLRDFRHDK